jgi:hypothetical protein
MPEDYEELSKELGYMRIRARKTVKALIDHQFKKRSRAGKITVLIRLDITC